MTRIYAFANQKGGVGKTTTAINLGAYLAASGRRVLLVDSDPQANATSSLAVDPKQLDVSIYDALVNGVHADRIIKLTKQLRLDLLPAAPALAGAEVELVSLSDRAQRLQQALRPILPRYDLVILDCPPSLSLLTVNALTAATHGVVITIQCEYLPLEGLGRLYETIQRVRASLNPNLRIFGIVMTMFDSRTNLSQQVVAEVRRHFPQETFRSIIPRNVRLSEAPSYGEPISTYAPHSAGAQAYAALAQEFIAREDGPGRSSP